MIDCRATWIPTLDGRGKIGNESYFLSTEGKLMPTHKDQPASRSAIFSRK
jgi:hypothetical protein